MMKEFLLATAMMATGATALAGQAQPNVLFISIDDLRPELACYGSPQVKTPYIDRLASQGTVFTRAYCQVPVCGASRASMLTAILPTPRRFTSYKARADQEVPGAVTLPEAFKNAGYTTLSNGKIFHDREDANDRSWSEPAWRPEISHALSHDPETREKLSGRGRGRIYEAPDVPDDAYHDGRVAQKTIEDLRRLKKEGKPFLLGCGFIRPHLPFYAPKKYWDLYERDEIEIADNRYRPKNAPGALRGSGEFKSYHPGGFKVNSEAWHRMMRHGYMASTSYVDKLTGDVLDELERLGLAGNTIVVIWGDHGWHLGEHNFWGKHNTTHLSLRMPLIVKVPGKQAGSTQALVEAIDMFPTLCTLAGIDVPVTVQGRSFATLLDDPGQSFRDVAYSRFGSGDAVVTERFNYTSYNGGKAEMLHDHKHDPQENENVAGKPEYKETVLRMRALLKQKKQQAAGWNAEKTAVQPSSTQRKQAPGYEGDVPMPTHSEVRYGQHGRQVLDLWQAESDQPTPVVLVIHGGGWTGGSKERMDRFADVNALLEAGISVAANNYRLMKHARGVEPPVKAPMHDSACALQFLRSKAGEWNLDASRIGLAGGSAGACTALWLAYHDDLADPDSVNPIARESTRVMCAAVRGAQTSLDPEQMKAWIPNMSYGSHAFGKKNFARFLADREAILPWINEYSPYALVSKDDPPVAIYYGSAPAMGKPQKNATHSANFGIGLQQRCRELDIDCEVVFPETTPAAKVPTAYLINMLNRRQLANE